MKTTYLFSGVDKVKGFNLEQAKYLKKDIKDNSIITYIASSFDSHENNNIYFNKMKEFFKNINITFKNEYLIDNRIDKNQAIKILQNSDIVYIMGGDPYSEMGSIKKYGLDGILKTKDGITIGVSAGSINMASSACYMDYDKSNELLEYDGIGLTDINIYPHLDFSDTDYMEELFDVSKTKKIIALPNDSFIRIENNNIEYIGDYYVVENGIININGLTKEEYLNSKKY